MKVRSFAVSLVICLTGLAALPRPPGRVGSSADIRDDPPGGRSRGRGGRATPGQHLRAADRHGRNA
jgi:hypothetical protein